MNIRSAFLLIGALFFGSLSFAGGDPGGARCTYKEPQVLKTGNLTIYLQDGNTEKVIGTYRVISTLCVFAGNPKITEVLDVETKLDQKIPEYGLDLLKKPEKGVARVDLTLSTGLLTLGVVSSNSPYSILKVTQYGQGNQLAHIKTEDFNTYSRLGLGQTQNMYATFEQGAPRPIASSFEKIFISAHLELPGKKLNIYSE